MCRKNFVFQNKGKQHIRVHKDAILEVQEKENVFNIEPGHCVPFRLGARVWRKRRDLEEQKALAGINGHNRKTYLHFLSKKRNAV